MKPSRDRPLGQDLTLRSRFDAFAIAVVAVTVIAILAVAIVVMLAASWVPG